MLGYFESSSNCHKRMWWRFIKTPFQFMIVKFAKHQDNKFWYHHTKDFENTQVNIGTNLTYCSYLNMDQISHALSLKVKSMSIKLYISICVLHFKKLNKTNTLHTPIQVYPLGCILCTLLVHQGFLFSLCYWNLLLCTTFFLNLNQDLT